jgi:secreted PhoX family phosphatase
MKTIDLPSANPVAEQTFGMRMSRRVLLDSAGALAVLQTLPARARRPTSTPFTFTSVPLSEQADSLVVPSGYRWRVMAASGDRLDGSGAGMRPCGQGT